VTQIDKLELGEGFSGRVAQSGEALVVGDVSQDPRLTRMAVQEAGLRSLAAVPLWTKGDVLGTLFAVTRDHREFTDRDMQLLTSIGQQIGVGIENARLFQDTKDRVAQLTALQRTTRAVASTLDLDQLLNLITQQATTLLEADGGILNLVDWETNEDRVVAATGITAFTLGYHSPLDESLSGWVSLHNEPLLSNRVTEDNRVYPGSRSWVARAKIGSTAIAPLTIKDQVMGTLVTVGTQRGKETFDQADLDLLVAFANQAAVAIENARLYEQAQELAAVHERQRLARDLHDAVTQTLFSASLIAESLPDIWQSDEDEGRSLLQELRQLSRGALAEMRTLLLELRPAVLAAADLGDLLRQLGEAVTGRTGATVTVTVNGECELVEEVRVVFYRIAQEALNNMVKHARASHVTITLHCVAAAEDEKRAKSAELRVCDDGIGFDADEIEPGELGLGIMQERAQSIDGELTIESQPGQGTQVAIIWKG
jgi:signal transduction histidine kinase